MVQIIESTLFIIPPTAAQQPPPQPPLPMTTSAASPTHELKERFKKPTEYEKGISEFPTWKTMLFMYLAGNNALYPSDREKI